MSQNRSSTLTMTESPHKHINLSWKSSRPSATVKVKYLAIHFSIRVANVCYNGSLLIGLCNEHHVFYDYVDPLQARCTELCMLCAFVTVTNFVGKQIMRSLIMILFV